MKKVGFPMSDFDAQAVIKALGSDRCIEILKKMVLIRQFELQAELAYQNGKIGGFLHLYIGQEAIQTGAVEALGVNQWYSATYRCHALALLLGETPKSLMAELYGKITGNAKGRGGSMHMYSDHMLGGFGIVAGQIPIATGAAFSCSYLHEDRISVCFMGDGSVAQGVFHESVNLASLWSLPCMYVVENNQWSMGTPLSRTLAHYDIFLENFAKANGIPYVRVDGMDVLQTYEAFLQARKTMKERSSPIIVECIAERFKGHSISDPGLYRTKEELKECVKKDPISRLKKDLLAAHVVTEDHLATIEAETQSLILEASASAEADPWPDPLKLEDDVFAKSL